MKLLITKNNSSVNHLFIGETISQTGSVATTFLIPIIGVISLHASPLLMGILACISWLPSILFSLIAGRLADQFPQQELMIACNIISATVLIFIPLFQYTKLLSIYDLMCVLFITGICRTIFNASFNSLIPSLVESEKLISTNSLFQSGMQCAQIGGKSLGVLISNLVLPAYGLIFDALTFMFSTIFLLIIRQTPYTKYKEKQHKIKSENVKNNSIFIGFQIIKSNSCLLCLVILFSLANSALAMLQSLEVIFLANKVGMSTTLIGFCITFGSIGGVLGAYCTRKFVELFGFCNTLRIIPFLTFPLSGAILLSNIWIGFPFIGYFIISLGLTICAVITFTYAQGICEKEFLGRLAAAIRFSTQLFLPIAALLSGCLAQAISIEFALNIACLTLTFTGIMFFFMFSGKHENFSTLNVRS